MAINALDSNVKNDVQGLRSAETAASRRELPALRETPKEDAVKTEKVSIGEAPPEAPNYGQAIANQLKSPTEAQPESAEPEAQSAPISVARRAVEAYRRTEEIGALALASSGALPSNQPVAETPVVPVKVEADGKVTGGGGLVAGEPAQVNLTTRAVEGTTTVANDEKIQAKPKEDSSLVENEAAAIKRPDVDLSRIYEARAATQRAQIDAIRSPPTE